MQGIGIAKIDMLQNEMALFERLANLKTTFSAFMSDRGRLQSTATPVGGSENENSLSTTPRTVEAD